MLSRNMTIPREEFIQHSTAETFDQSLPGVELVHALHFVGAVVLRREAQGLGLHSQVCVFGDKDNWPR